MPDNSEAKVTVRICQLAHQVHFSSNSRGPMQRHTKMVEIIDISVAFVHASNYERIIVKPLRSCQ